MASDSRYDVIIVGAGATGLFLGCCLQQLGIRFVLLERRKDNRSQTRSIGIHPPSLELCDKLGVSAQLLQRGVKVRTGRAMSGKRELGVVSFDRCPPPHNYVLTLPQYETEKVLEEHIEAKSPAAIRRSVTIENVVQHDHHVEVVARYGAAATDRLSASLIVASDGRRSMLCEKAEIEFEGDRYEDTFVMGDFQDRTSFGTEARVYLDSHGFIESFPLPGGIRRWVMQTERLQVQPDENAFCEAIRTRTGETIQGGLVSLLSAFGVEHYVAETFAKGRIILCGDAAHIVSPIGGQGMNLGWMDAWDVAGAIQRILQDKADLNEKLSIYSRKGRARAHQAIKRAETYMSIGRKSVVPWRRMMLLNFVLRRPFRDLAARYFTMRWL